MNAIATPLSPARRKRTHSLSMLGFLPPKHLADKRQSPLFALHSHPSLSISAQPIVLTSRASLHSPFSFFLAPIIVLVPVNTTLFLVALTLSPAHFLACLLLILSYLIISMAEQGWLLHVMHVCRLESSDVWLSDTLRRISCITHYWSLGAEGVLWC